VLAQQVHRLSRDLEGAVRRALEFLQDASRQHRNVLAPIAKRRQVDVEHVQPVEQVGAELLAGHGFGQIPVRRRDHADVRLHGARAAKAHELAFLEHAQELRLRGSCHLGDFVEKEHPTGRQLDLSRLRLLRAGEGAALEPEQFGLEQVFWQRRAVDRDERAAPSWRALVDEPRDDLLAGAGLALQARRRFGRGHLRRAPDDFTPRTRCADGRVNMAADDRRKTAICCLRGHHRGRTSRLMSAVRDISCYVRGVHWPTSVVNPIHDTAMSH
jgi:hypothetical protein